MGKCWKTCLDYVLCLLIKVIDFTANGLARTQPVHYQQVDSTTGQVFIQGYVSMEIQRIIWNLHGL